MPREEIIAEALRQWGEEAQLLMVIEEMSELTKSILKYRREHDPADIGVRIIDIAEEHADVRIMLDQLAYIMRQHDPGYSEHVTHFTEEKVTRLVNRLERGRAL